MALQVALGGPHGPRDARQRVIFEATGALAGGPAGGRTWHGGQTMAVSCRVWRQTCLGKRVWVAVPVGGSDECKAANVGSWWQPVACT